MRFLFTKQTFFVVVLATVVFGVGSVVWVVLNPVQPAVVVPEPVVAKTEVIGTSVEGRPITATIYGSGEKHLVFVGGVHGGYEWNSTLLAYEFMDYLDEHMAAIPSGTKVTVIPSANPDGLFKVVGKEGRFSVADVSPSEALQASGRFNANGVDLNRNFDCKWKPESMWRGKVVSAGTSAFSEPEAQAIRDFAVKYRPDAFVFWHSQANAVYASECEGGILPGTRTIMNAYSRAAGYEAVDAFDAYAITGDAEGWLASVGIPAITVELATHESVEWEKNLAGIKALLQ